MSVDKFKRSRELYEEAQRYLPGGVDSPVRAHKAVGATPLFIERGKGSKIFDADGNEYIDYICSWGPLILGHARPEIVRALKKAAERGTSFGISTELEIKLAKLITAAMPSMEMLRFVNSGTEATMTALRLARAFTGRDKIVKFAGGYHGHADGLLTTAGSGLATLDLPDSPGVPASHAQNTLTARYNDLASVQQIFNRYPREIAGVIIEPVAANMGVVPPLPDFLNDLRLMTREYGALLIFDEVITGFRVAYGGAQELYEVTPDMTCLGKIIGGGLPVGVYGGRRDIMKMMAPVGPVYQAGTLSGNPLAMTAGIETLTLLGHPDVYSKLEKTASGLQDGIRKSAADNGIRLQVARIASLLTVFFNSNAVVDYESAKRSDTSRFAQFFRGLLDRGIYWPPSQFEAAFISLSHSDKDIRSTLNVVGEVFRGFRSKEK
ncbi:MAG: glutamate-1-semialdehyde 2,1-aminomutase [Dehalococcoidia bacterium]